MSTGCDRVGQCQESGGGRGADGVRRLAGRETFQFSCHPDISCFNECCRELDLALSPYDVLRLKNALAISSAEFLERYAVIEHAPDLAFPQVYLGMVDDGSASCPFVTQAGCRVYQNRPGACRIYPLGRASRLLPDGGRRDYYVLLSEAHCRGGEQEQDWQTSSWLADQGLLPYNECNDLVMTLLQHEKIRNGMKPDAEQLKNFLLALYNLDRFRELLPSLAQKNDLSGLSSQGSAPWEAEDQTLLEFAVTWLHHELFGA